jgi:hypothetical protein
LRKPGKSHALSSNVGDYAIGDYTLSNPIKAPKAVNNTKRVKTSKKHAKLRNTIGFTKALGLFQVVNIQLY